MITLFQIIFYLLNILSFLVIGSAILSLLFAFNVLNYSNRGLFAFNESLQRLLDPLYRPFRRLLPAAGGVDWSPFLLLITIGIVKIILSGIVSGI
ncbi:MAG: YggT family protein [Sphingomicrobium sp.]